MKKSICLFLFVLPLFVLSAQTNIDSLVNVLETQKLSTDEKFSVYNQICYYYINSDPQKALLYIQDALSFAKKEKNKKWMSSFYTYTGQVNKIGGHYDTALDYYAKALDIAIDGKIETQEAYVYMSMASLNHQRGKTITSLELLMKALSIYEKTETINHKKKEALILYNIGTIHRGFENYDRAIHYLTKAEKLAKDLNDSEIIMSVYFDIGVIFRNKKEYDKALDYSLKSLEICRSYGDKMTETLVLGGLAMIYNEGFNNYPKAEEYANEALRIAKDINDPYILMGTWNTLAGIYLSQKRFTECETAAMNGWQIDSINTDITSYITSYLTYKIGLANFHLRNNEKGVYYLDKSIEINKQTSSKNFQSLIIDLETKYETEKKEMRISVLEEEQKLYIGLGIAIVTALLLGLGFLFYYHHSRRRIAEQQIKQLKQEKELIATRSALKAEQTEREIIARDLHDGVGAMLSVVKNNMDITKSHSIIENAGTGYLNMAMDVLDKSITELRRVSHHIMPSILIENGLVAALDDFCRSIPEAEFHCAEPDRRFDPEKELVIYRCAYELINNALRHSNSSRIEVHLNMDEELVYLSVVDYGDGFDPQSSPMGMGINNMRTRLSIFGGRIDIHSELEKGTEVNIELGIKGDYPSMLTS